MAAMSIYTITVFAGTSSTSQKDGDTSNCGSHRASIKPCTAATNPAPFRDFAVTFTVPSVNGQVDVLGGGQEKSSLVANESPRG
jgi:hypothetical protein